MRGEGQRGEAEAFPVRQPTANPLRSSGRHRRAVPASLPQTAPALVLAVPGADTDLTSGPAGELTAILRVDNPAVEVRAARIDGGGPNDPSDLRAVLADVATRRPDDAPVRRSDPADRDGQPAGGYAGCANPWPPAA